MKYAIRIPRLAGVLSWLLLTFLVLFPKGGIKSGGAPITWGYVLLALLFIPLGILRLFRFPLRASPLSFASFASFLPFQFLLYYSIWANGEESFSFVVALTLVFVFLPAIFLGIFPAYLPSIDFERFRRHFCFCILAAAIWGIFLFFYHPLAGHYIEIPYLTVNAGDYGQLETTKHINRGGYLKLISTYNNGNLYGVATLILFPLYVLLEPKKWKRNVVRIALVLTLSRTVWLGLIVEQFLSLLASLPSVLRSFPRVRVGRILPQIIAVGATVLFTFFGLFFSGGGANFLLDRDLGGRAPTLELFGSTTLLPDRQVTTFSELVYVSAVLNYGVIGLLAILLIFLTPLFLLFWQPMLLNSPTRRAAAKGLILYSFLAGVDGAILLIPVMAFYFFCYMVLIHGFPGEQTPAPNPWPASLDLPAPNTPHLA